MKLLFCALCCFLFAPTWSDASARTVSVQLSGGFNGWGQKENSCKLHDVINIVITADDVIITLEVSKSPRVTQDAPVYVIGEDGHLYLQAPQTLETYALYQDLKQGAAVMVTCPPGERRPLVEGSVMHKGRKFELRHNFRHRRDVSSDVYQLTEVRQERNTDHVFDYAFPPGTRPHTSPLPGGDDKDDDNGDDGKEGSHRRPRRQAENTDVNIDTVAVVAFDIYNKFLAESKKLGPGTEADALDRTRKYFALLMSEVDLLYQGIGARLPFHVNIRLAGIIVAQTANASGWTEGRKETPKVGNRYELNATKAVPDVTSWISGNSSLSAMDYFVLFTGYDVYTEAGRITVGFAYVGAVCASSDDVTENPGFNVALVEVTDLNLAIDTTAHEIGHGLGALHDGANNSCAASSYFIMAPYYGNITNVTRANLGSFSNCSLSYFSQTFSRLSVSSPSNSCIHGVLPTASVPAAPPVPPGQIYDIHAQCKRAFGDNSTVCQENFQLGSAMCNQAFCTVAGVCQTIALLRGTSCGNKKWCVNAVCVESQDAPSLNEFCPFGDKNTVFSNENGANCSQLPYIFRGYCYDDKVSDSCCATCPKVKNSSIVGCEFGDRQKLPVIANTNHTCSQAARLTPAICYNEDITRVCCQSCAEARRNSETCPYGDRVVQFTSSSLSTCEQYARDEPWRCYDSPFSVQCCGSCKAVNTGPAGCEYGDRAANCHTGVCSSADLRQRCCKTCAGISAPPGGTTSTPPGGSNSIPAGGSNVHDSASAMSRTGQLLSVFTSLSTVLVIRVLGTLW